MRLDLFSTLLVMTSVATACDSTKGGTDGSPGSTNSVTSTTTDVTGTTTNAGTGDMTTANGDADTTGSAGTTGSVDSSGSESTHGVGSGSDGSTDGDDGLGMLAGRCGLIDAARIDSSSPFTFQNAIDFGVAGFDYDLLTAGAQEVFDAAGGAGAAHAEAIAFDVLARCEGAALLATEAEIQYFDPDGEKADFSVDIEGRTVGVRIARAFSFPLDAPYDQADAENLLTNALTQIAESSANVAPADAWTKQILHVLAYGDMHAQALLAAHATLDSAAVADTVLVITVTDGDDAFVY